MSTLDFLDLAEDKSIQIKLQNFHDSITKIEELLDKVLEPGLYDKLSVKQKVDHDLFLTYTLNTLYWLLLRNKGLDPNANDVKNQLNRVKEYMVKAKKAHERNTIRPRIKKDVAARFVKHGIHYRKEKTDIEEEHEEQPAKKKKSK